MVRRIIIFIFLNFAALAIGGLFTKDGVTSDWYINLAKAPWTPPGWVFGAAWTTIMVCFSLYMAYLWPLVEIRKKLVGLFTLQWILNVSWNPCFFYFHEVALALILISSLTLLVAYFTLSYRPVLKGKSPLLLPYLVWLLIATSLNAYILVYN
jgi:translocator protein